MNPPVTIDCVLCWHMHQPEYRDALDGAHHQPWTYLHAIKDYVDMAAHLEAIPGARAVVNFAPVLLDQIEDYARDVAAALADGAPLRDPVLALLQALPERAETEERRARIAACLRANRERMIERFEPFARLARIAALAEDDAEVVRYLDDALLADLAVWYHLAWLGESVRESDPRARRLVGKGGGYDAADRRALLELIGELLADVGPRYRRLAERGRVELACSPATHPMLPLLLDWRSARDAQPEVVLPAHPAIARGEERARWHLADGRRTFERHFGFAPRGCWPSEGGVSAAALALIEEAGFDWAASGESVLRNSLRLAGARADHAGAVCRPYRVSGSALSCFFRDDELSDRIGFSYATWHADDAVADLLAAIEARGAASGARRPLVALILDGENAWEHYPENARYFLPALYRGLAEHPRIRPTTFSALIDEGRPAGDLAAVCAGSWVYGTFSTWIGDPDKNRAWQLLAAAEAVYDEAAPGLEPARAAAALRQLAVCEGSDWFWWFGDYNPPQAVADFDRLYRGHLARLYELLGRAPPPSLASPLGTGAGDPEGGGTMRRGTAA